MDNFSSKFLFLSVGCQLVTFAGILVARYFFHLPWQPKWPQLGALLHEEPVYTVYSLASSELSISGDDWKAAQDEL